MYKYLNPSKYYNKIIYYLARYKQFQFEKKYDVHSFQKQEIRKFEKFNWNYQLAREKLDDVLVKKSHQKFDELLCGMASVHWILFSAISLNFNPKKILEIGTFDGQTTSLLSDLFPDSTIFTVELPDNDPIFKQYGREDLDKRSEFYRKQEINLNHKNIEAMKINSFFLPEKLNDKFDLIWIDGGHLYPEIAWDICNAYHAINDKGYILVDDVIMDLQGYRDDYVSPDSYSVIEYIKQRTNVEVTYFLKRLSPKWSADSSKRKFVAVLQKK